MNVRTLFIPMLAALLAAPGAALAAGNITVDVLTDDLAVNGNCTLREAITAANTNAVVDGCIAGTPGFDFIDLPSGTITLSIAGAGEDSNATGDLDVTEAVQINGAGANLSTVDGGLLDRVFDVHAGPSGIAYVRITNGAPPSLDGGGIRVDGGAFTLEDSRIDGCVVVSACGGAIAVLNTGSAVIQRSLLTTNDATSGGAACGFGPIDFQAVTLSGNTSAADGAAIWSSSATPWSVTSSTLADNFAGGGADGISSSVTNPTVTGSILKNGSVNCTQIQDGGGNVFSAPCAGVTTASLVADPKLEPLGANGGPTDTYSLAPASPAIDQGAASCAATDQRGSPRFVGLRCDAGALELAAPPNCSIGWPLSFEFGSWKMVSPPCGVAGETVTTQLGDDFPVGNYDFSWVLFMRNAPTDSYVKAPVGGNLMPEGNGFWLIAEEETFGGAFTLSGTENISNVFVSLTGNALGRNNLVGNPFSTWLPWSDVRFDYGTGYQTPQKAEDDGAASRFAWTWNGGSYQVFDPQVPGGEGTFFRGDAFWVRVFSAQAVTLVLPALSPPAAERGRAAGAAPLGAGEWLVRISAAGGGMRDPGNAFGRLAGASTGFDRRDHPEPPPFGKRWLTVVFSHDDWNTGGDWITGDFRPVDSPEAGDSWDFAVRTSLREEVTLQWEGPAGILACASVIDLDTGATVSAASGTLTFRASGPEHRFRFVVPGEAGSSPRAREDSPTRD